MCIRDRWYSDERIYTRDSLEYVYRPVPKLALDIHVRAAHNAHVALTNGPRDSQPMYEILLGGWENSASVIRYSKEKPDKVNISVIIMHMGNHSCYKKKKQTLIKSHNL